MGSEFTGGGGRKLALSIDFAYAVLCYCTECDTIAKRLFLIGEHITRTLYVHSQSLTRRN